MTLQCAGSLFSWESFHSLSSLLLQPGPPPRRHPGQRREPPGKPQGRLMVIAARTGRVAAPLIHHRAGINPEKRPRGCRAAAKNSDCFSLGRGRLRERVAQSLIRGGSGEGTLDSFLRRAGTVWCQKPEHQSCTDLGMSLLRPLVSWVTSDKLTPNSPHYPSPHAISKASVRNEV